jgi:hypothetical protein
MPTYLYKCESGHQREHMCSMSDKPKSFVCSECDNDMKSVPNLSMQARPIRFGSNKFTHVRSGRTERMYHYRCESGHDTDDWFDKAPETTPCQEEGCDLTSNRVFGMNIETFWLANEREGGYYDKTLGCQIFTEAQRKQICKEKGLTPVDGDFDVNQATYEGRKKQDDLQEGYRDYYNRVMHDPAYQSARKAIDRGDLPQLIHPDTL